MKLYDVNDGRFYSLLDLFKEWQQLRMEEPENHADNFTTELYEVLMATINGRNDLDIVGLTPAETNNYILSLRSVIMKGE